MILTKTAFLIVLSVRWLYQKYFFSKKKIFFYLFEYEKNILCTHHTHTQQLKAQFVFEKCQKIIKIAKNRFFLEWHHILKLNCWGFGATAAKNNCHDDMKQVREFLLAIDFWSKVSKE